MNEYLLSVIGVVLFSSVLLAILPSGKTSELIKAIARIGCLVTILAPIVQFFVAGKEFEGIFDESSIQTQTAFIQYCSEERIQEAEILLTNELQDKYSEINSIDLICGEAEDMLGNVIEMRLRVEKVVVRVKLGTTMERQNEILDYIYHTYGCKGEVIINVQTPAGE